MASCNAELTQMGLSRCTFPDSALPSLSIWHREDLILWTQLNRICFAELNPMLMKK